jgi:hypothetical protein
MNKQNASEIFGGIFAGTLIGKESNQLRMEKAWAKGKEAFS